MKRKPNSGSSKIYNITLKPELAEKFAGIQQIVSQMHHLSDVADEIIFQDDSLSNTLIECNITIITDLDNRIDISDKGIPRSSRKSRLGFKIYRAILAFEDYFTSNEKNLYGYGKLI